MNYKDINKVKVGQKVNFRLASTDDIEYHSEEEHSAEEEHYRFRKTPVKIGVIDRGYAEIFPGSGVSENSVIVLEGSYYIDAEMNKGEGGHSH